MKRNLVGNVPGVMSEETQWLRQGLSVELHAAARGRFGIGPAIEHQLLVHVGAPIRVRSRIDDLQGSCLRQHGDLDLVPAGSIAVWEADQASIALHFRFTAGLLREMAAILGFDADLIELTPQLRARDTQLEKIITAIDSALVTEVPLDRLYGESLATALLARLFHRFVMVKPAKTRAGLSKRQIQSVTDHIERHIDERLTLADLALVAGMGVSHFRTLFRTSMAMPVHQYVIQRRVERAKTLLLDGRSITQAAVEAGFADHSHLARCMRRILGLRPLDVIRLARPTAN